MVPVVLVVVILVQIWLTICLTQSSSMALLVTTESSCNMDLVSEQCLHLVPGTGLQSRQRRVETKAKPVTYGFCYIVLRSKNTPAVTAYRLRCCQMERNGDLRDCNFKFLQWKSDTIYIRSTFVPYLFIAFLNEVGVLYQSLFKLGQTVLVDMLGVSGAQSLCVVQPDQEGSQDILLLLLQPPLLLGGQTLLQRAKKWRHNTSHRTLLLPDISSCLP